ncbi:MAG: insulinase family protein [Parcubacteria group bacterium]|nr:insulinase family protein [Parcubacteria group bacterium]
MFTQHTLPNGLRLIIAPHADTRAVSFLVLVKIGSRQETPRTGGVAHFVEHLMFKGTSRRPDTLAISQELDSVGAEYNAWTAKDHTGYYIKVASEHFPLAADMLSDMLANSKMDSSEVERERGTILEEINMYEDNPMAKVGDLFEETLFGRGTPLGRHVIGTRDTVGALGRGALHSFWRRHYTGSNMVVAVSGNVRPERVRTLVARHFGSLPRGSRSESRRTAPRKGIKLAAFKKETKQAHLILGFPGINYTASERYAVRLLATILGGNMSSRLFIQVRERLGLCYFIRAGLDSYEDTGAFSIQAGLDLRKVGTALSAVSRELRDVKQRGVSAEELEKSKEYAKGKLALAMEDSLEVASFYGRQVLFERRVSAIADVVKKIDRVRLADVTAAAQKILRREHARVVTLAPFSNINRFAKKLDF